jgi:hypothetical protein
VPVLPGDTPNTLHRGTPLIAAGSAAAASTQRSSSDIVEQRSQNVNRQGHHQAAGLPRTAAPRPYYLLLCTRFNSSAATAAGLRRLL